MLLNYATVTLELHFAEIQAEKFFSPTSFLKGKTFQQDLCDPFVENQKKIR